MLDFSDRTRTGISKLISRCAQVHPIYELIHLDKILKFFQPFVHRIFEVIYPDSAVQCWRHRQKSKWSELRQLFIDVSTGPWVIILLKYCIIPYICNINDVSMRFILRMTRIFGNTLLFSLHFILFYKKDFLDFF